MLIQSSRTASVLLEFQSDAQQREAARVRALIRRQPRLEDPVNISEAIRIGATTYKVNALQSYVIATGIYMWNGDPEHVIGVIPHFTKANIEIISVESSSSSRR
jgi:hypothetical protein